MGRIVIPCTDLNLDHYREVIESSNVAVRVHELHGAETMVCSRDDQRREFSFWLSGIARPPEEMARSEPMQNGAWAFWRSRWPDEFARIKGTMNTGAWTGRDYVSALVCNLLADNGLILMESRFEVPVTPNCPYCGRPLRAKLSKQCFACGADWHAKNADV
jgi:hypothetical protein